MGGVGTSSIPSLQQSSDLEKTQAELRQTFTTAEKFRRELEFLQKGGDPLDLKPGNATSISFHSTSLKGQPEQFVTSEAKGSFAITASPHGDSVESSGRLGAPSVCEPNSADNLMLLKESGDIERPKKSYKRRIRSRPNRDPVRHASRDYKGLTRDADVALKNSVSHLENEVDGLPIKTVEPESLHLRDSKVPTNGNAEDIKSIPLTEQRFDEYNRNGLHTTEQNLGINNLDAEKNDDVLNIGLTGNDDEHGVKEEAGLEGSESVKVVGSDVCTDPKIKRNPNSQNGNANDPPSTLTVNRSTDEAEQNACSLDKLATKEHEDSVLEEARIIEAKRKRIAELSVRTLPLGKRLKSHWDFVLEEMSWLANDFTQERLWKVTAAAQISRRVAFASRRRFQLQSSLQKQKELSHKLADAVMQFWHTIQVKCVEKDKAVGIQGYAMRFMEYNSSQVQCNETQVHVSPDIVSDVGVMDHLWDDNLTEENLFYTVPPGAIEAYRKAIDSHMLHFERTGTSMQEEVDTSLYDAVADNDAYEDDEEETNTYYLPGGFEGRKSAKAAQKRRQNFNLYGARSYARGDDVSFVQGRTVGNQPAVLSGKRYGSSLNVTIPTKRVRTASRQRIISPYNAGTSAHIHTPHRTDASSADTNSFQDEHSGLHGGTQVSNNLEAESAGDYEKQLQFDSIEVSNRPKKKKKDKHPGSTFEHRWQLDSSFQNDQKDLSRRRPDTHQFDSNGSSAVSQMSNMSNPNKFMKLLVRDRGRKVKALKNPVRQPGSGSPWSLFEDQALVVLVHDMGPNWELISDAINSTLQFKCIFRKPMECKGRHKILMDMNSGDGADSADDSGSSQPYPSTLPGIPEGSARQLFQRLQGPMEEDTLKSHFEKIINLGQKQHYRHRSQKDNQDPKHLQQPHSSHAFALSQVFPNNLNGGPVLTPLELCEAISSSQDVLPIGYQGLHTGGLPPLNHGPVAPVLPGLGSVSTSAPGGSNLSAASAQLSPSVREGRYGVPRTGSLLVDEQQRLQQYSQMLSARVPPGSVNDRAVRMLPAANGMGVMSANNRNMKMTRPGLQGTASPSMLSSGSSTPSSSSMQSGPANPMLRPRGPTQVSPHMLSNSNNSHHPHHFQGPPPSHHANPAYAMRLAKERQLQQQRLLQKQQQQFSTSNPPQQYQQPHQQAKLMKGSLVNGFSTTDKQKTLKRPFDSSDNSKNQNPNPPVTAASSNQLLHLNQKLVNQKKATAQKLLILNRKVNTSDQTTSKQDTSSQPSTAVTNDANSSETPVVSSAAPAESEPSGLSMNQSAVHRPTSSDNLTNLVEHDTGVQQQQQPPS